MNRFVKIIISTALFAALVSPLATPLKAQERTAYPALERVVKPDSLLTPAELKTRLRQQHRDSVRANKNLWTTLLGGPSYTPEASIGVAGAVLFSFQTNQADSISQRSYIPFGFNASLNGTLVVAGASTLFFNENRFRIYTFYGVRNEPANFYGVGMTENSSIERGESTTEYQKLNIYLRNKFVWEVKPKLFVGQSLDLGYTRSSDLNPLMEQHYYVNMFSRKYFNAALGASVEYDTRDDVATPNAGLLLSGATKFFGHYLGGDYNYQSYDFEYRQYQYLFGRAVLGWVVRTTMTYGDVPFTELPMFGSPFDLRGFYWGQYRDKSMGYAIAEYRQMLGSQADYKAGRAISKFGYVVWAGTGTLGNTPSEWREYRYNFGIGLRAQIQPRKNFRFDIGKGQGESGMLFYMNMTEAF
ncbi:MAG: BamA/TamA family outer membrane protein [Rikenellaceae bacterium]